MCEKCGKNENRPMVPDDSPTPLTQTALLTSNGGYLAEQEYVMERKGELLDILGPFQFVLFVEVVLGQ